MWGGWQDRGAVFSSTFLPFSALFQAGMLKGLAGVPSRLFSGD